MFSYQVFGAAAILAALPGTFAVPDVTAVPVDSGCASYPSYNASTQSTDTFLLSIVNSGNPAIEGFFDTQNYVLGSNGVRFGYITFPSDNQVAKTGLRCTNNALQALVATGVGGYSWEALQIAPYPYDATLIYDVQGSDPKLFKHVIDGQQQDGLYLGGYDNTTTWGVKYNPKGSGAYGQDFYYIRLLGPDSADPSTGKALQDGEFTAFIKVATP